MPKLKINNKKLKDLFLKKKESRSDIINNLNKTDQTVLGNIKRNNSKENQIFIPQNKKIYNPEKKIDRKLGLSKGNKRYKKSKKSSPNVDINNPNKAHGIYHNMDLKNDMKFQSFIHN